MGSMYAEPFTICTDHTNSVSQASVFAFMALLARKEGIGAAFAKSAKNTLSTSPATADALLKHYALDSATSDDESMVKIVQFASDIAFYAATTKFASGFPCKTYVLHFNERNPWDGMFKGHATHIMDVAFLFQNYNGHLSAEQQTSADQLGRDVIAFVNGKEPWDPFQEKGVVAVLEGGKRELVADRSKETGRDQKIFELAKDVGLDALMGVWENFLRGA